MTDLRDLKGQLPLIMTGDFNARTGDLSDMGLNAEGLGNPNDFENWKVSDSFPIHLNCDRTSHDKHTN